MLSKRFNIKMLASVVVLVMALCASAYAGLKSGSWSLNPADFRYDMSLYFSLADRSLEDLDSYEIGAFVDDECRGLAEKLELTDGKSCLYMRIRSNSAQGANIEFLLRHKATGECVVLRPENGDDFIFKSNDRVGMPSAPFVLARFFNVEISAGENGSVDFENGLYKEGAQLNVEAVPNTGYHFNEWSDGSKEAQRSITVTGDLSLQASFEVNFYKAVFTIDGEEFKTIEVAYGDEIVAPEVPEKDGYSFSGWSDLPETMPAHDIEVTGTYNINKYKAVFKIDGEEFQTVEYAFGETIVAPEAPAKEGYTFSGWSDLPETMPDHDIEVTGTYNINKYKAVFKIDGEEIASMELEYGAPLEAPAVEDKEGYTFNGWGDLPATMPAHDLEMHSSYTVNVYSLSFSIDGETILSSEVPFGSSIIAPEAPVKEGYTFGGWGEVPEVMPARDLEFEGTYTVNAYTLTYVIDGEVAYTAQVNYGEAIPEFNAPEKEGYSFSGWSEIPDSMPARDVEINGSYIIDSYTITFRIGEDVIASNVLPFGAEIQAPEAPAKEGYTFGGWSEFPAVMPAADVVVTGDYNINVYTVTYIIDNEVFAVQEYEYGAPIVPVEAPDKEGHSFSGWGDVPATMPAFDLVLGGTYADIFYTVTFRIDGVVIFTDDLVFGADISVPNAPEKEGYSFNGWGEVPATMPACNLDFEGSYTVNLYKLTFSIGDEVVYEGEIPYGSEIVAPDAPAKEGYSFTGWGVVPSTMPASDLTITGAYEVNSYSLTFMIDDVVFYSTQLSYGSEIVAPEAPVKEGYSFSGWSELPEVMPAHDVVVAGTYGVNSYKLTFLIGDEVIFSGELNYGAEITVPEAPAKEGHSFAGWGMVPTVMPASDLVIEGSYNVNVYNLTFDIDGEIYFTTQLAYGSEITVPTDIPEKDGNTFMGWGNVPATMPAYDLVISGTYAVNHYTLTFRIGEEILFTGEQPFGSDIVVPEVPVKEGYTFSGWGEVPATMPARNLEFEGSYEANLYVLTFKIGDEVLFTGSVPFGSEIVVPEVPAKEGYTFSGWGVVPATMPASDLEITGSYEVNTYVAVFRIGDMVILSAQIPYGAEISLPEAPAKEGHTFMGWGDVPATMPAHDIEINGAYAVNSYKVTFMIGDEVISESEVLYGETIVVPDAPEKEGYSFLGWGVVPATMPASDLVFSGSYEINQYTLTVKINGEVIYSVLLPYGASVVITEPEVPEGQIFDGWEDEIPETMPAHDVVINGKVSYGSAVSFTSVDGNALVDVCNLNGIVIMRRVRAAEAFENLTPGLYLINGKKTLIKTSR